MRRNLEGQEGGAAGTWGPLQPDQGSGPSQVAAVAPQGLLEQVLAFLPVSRSTVCESQRVAKWPKALVEQLAFV